MRLITDLQSLLLSLLTAIGCGFLVVLAVCAIIALLDANDDE